MFHALGVRGFERAFEMSGSSLFTLGFVRPPDLATNVLAFLEAATGLAVLGLLIAYLPTIYGVVLAPRGRWSPQLAVRAGNPPSGVRAARCSRSAWSASTCSTTSGCTWQQWFAELEETHTSLGVLSFFRSPQAHRSWVTASGAVLDAASLRLAAVDLPFDPEAGLCMRAGVLRAARDRRLLRHPVRPGSAARAIRSASAEDEFLEACDALVEAGDPRPRRPRAGVARLHRLAGELRPVLLVGLAGFMMAPYAPWSSDRSLRYRRARCGRSTRPCPTLASAEFVEDPGLGAQPGSRRGG